MEDIQALTELATLLTAGVFAAFISVKLKLPTILGYLIAGVLLGLALPHALESELTGNIAQLGAAFLLFTIGIEFSLETIKSVYKVVVTGAIIQAVVTIIVSLIIFPMFGFSDYHAFFIGIMASMSSTAFVVRMLEAKDQTHTKAGTIMIGWLIMQDIMIILWFLLLGTFAPNNSADPDIFGAIARSIVVVAITYGVGKYLLPFVMKQVARTRSEELLLVSVVGTIVLFAVVAGQLEVSFTIGAFLAGLALSESFLNHEIFTEIKPLRNLFAMIFFVSIGTLLDLNAITEGFGILLAILLIIIPVKLVTIVALNLWFNVHIKNSLRVGLGIFQIGEFAFLAAQIGLTSGWIDQQLYSLVIAATVISMVLTPIMYGNLGWFYSLLEKRIKATSPNLYRGLFLSKIEEDIRIKGKMDGHVLICGYGQVGQYVATALKSSDIPFVAIELDAKIAEEAAGDKQTEMVYGDGSNPDILKQAFIDAAKVLVVTLPSKEESKKVIAESKNLNPKLKVIARTNHGIDSQEAMELIDHAIEPEFEAAVQIITRLYKLIHRRHKRALDIVSSIRKENLSNI